MEASLRWALASMIEFPVEEAAIAWMRIPTSDFDPKREKQLYVIVARKARVDEQSALFDKARMRLRAVDVRETALRNIAALVENKDEGLGLITVSDEGVTTTFTFRGELYLDRFISQKLDEIVRDSARQDRFCERVAQQLTQSMELIERNFPFFHFGRIVVAPLPAPLQLGVYLRDRLPVPVQQLDLSKFLDLQAVPQLLEASEQARYLVALGSALRGMKGAHA
jgi:MSHA biogenesis protein MshI